MADDIVTIGLSVDSREVKQGTRDLDELGKQGKETAKATDGLSSSFKFLGAAIAAAAGAALWKVIDQHREFTKAISELSAITGATGKDLEFYRQQAMELGRTTTFSAQEVATAFKLVASAKPDLLNSKEALAAVTKEVLTLAEASGMALPDAAQSLGGALNQWGADAAEASRYINVLAAGAKLGASEINETSQALKNAGAVAANLGLSFEEANAAIQAMAAMGLKGAEAGTGLRGVLLKLSTQSRDEFNPEIVGLATALKNLQDAHLSTAEKADIFGQESITAATALMTQAGAVEELTKGLHGTTEAYKQAGIMTDNLDGSVKKMNSSWGGAALIIGDMLNPAIRGATDLLAYLGKVVASIALGFRDMGEMLGAYAAAAVSAAELDFDGVQAILAARREQAAATQAELDAIWEEKAAVEASAETKQAAAAAEAESIKKTEETREAARMASKKRREEEAADEAKKLEEKNSKIRNELAKTMQQYEDHGKTKWQKDQERYAADIEANKAALDKKAITEQEYQNAVALIEQTKRDADAAIAEEQAQADLEKWGRDLEWMDAEFERDQENRERKLAAEADYRERLYNLETGSVRASYDFANAMRNMDYASAVQHGALMLSNVAKSSKSMFGVQKAFALAQAAISLPAAVLESFRNGGGFPFGLIPAGLMLAEGARQIGAINSASFGGGVSSGSIGGGSTSPSAPAGGLPMGSTALPGGEELRTAAPARELRVTVESDGPHSDGMRKFAESLAETLKDMGSNTNLVIA